MSILNRQWIITVSSLFIISCSTDYVPTDEVSNPVKNGVFTDAKGKCKIDLTPEVVLAAFGPGLTQQQYTYATDYRLTDKFFLIVNQDTVLPSQFYVENTFGIRPYKVAFMTFGEEHANQEVILK